VVNVVEREKVGEKLPKGWKWVRVEDVVDVRDGTHDSPSYCHEGIPFITSKNLKFGQIDFDNVQFISPQDHEFFKQRSCVGKGDILYAMIGTVGNPVIVRTDIEFSIKNVALFKFENSPFLNEYFCYLLQSPSVVQQVESLTQGGIQKFVSLKVLRNLLVPLPPLPEQKRIVDILTDRLSTIDKARTATEAQLEAAKALPAAYLREVFDSPEAQKWEKKRLGDIAETCSGSTPSRERKDYYIGEIPWIKTGELRDGIIYHSEEHISTLALRETSVKLLPAKTLLVAMYGQGQTRGRTGLLAQLATTNQACFAILPNDEEFEPKYLQFWFQNSYSRLREETEGRGGNQPNLNGELLRDQIVVLPPLDAQLSIVSNLERVNEKTQIIVKSLQSQLDTINKLPAVLLRQAFNGEL